MKTRLMFAAAVVLTFIAGLVGVLAYQNSLRTTQLSADYYFWAFELKEPVRVVTLMGISLALGFGTATALFGLPYMRAQSRAKQLERQLALADPNRNW